MNSNYIINKSTLDNLGGGVRNLTKSNGLLTPTEMSITLNNIYGDQSQIFSSIDTDGSIYNGKGWKENTHYSTSSKVEQYSSAHCLSGYIEIPNWDKYAQASSVLICGNTDRSLSFHSAYLYDVTLFSESFEFIGIFYLFQHCTYEHRATFYVFQDKNPKYARVEYVKSSSSTSTTGFLGDQDTFHIEAII